MIIHHLNCGSMCPYVVGCAVCHCLLVETAAGLVLVDAGLGDHVCRHPTRYMPSPLRGLLRPAFDPAESALAQLRRLGYAAEDVRHVVLTHLDLDHAGGILDFPQATVHVHGNELRAARAPRRLPWRWRYQQQLLDAPHSRRVYESGAGERWFGFAGVQALSGLPPEFLLVPMPGHTAGHCGVAIRAETGWVIHAGDAYLAPGAVDYRRPRPKFLLRLAQRLTALDESQRQQNQLQLAHLVARDQARVFCSHSAVEFKRCQRLAG